MQQPCWRPQCDIVAGHAAFQEPHQLDVSQWEAVFPDEIHSSRFLLNIAANATPHEQIFLYHRKGSAGTSLLACFSRSNEVHLWKFNSRTKFDWRGRTYWLQSELLYVSFPDRVSFTNIVLTPVFAVAISSAFRRSSWFTFNYTAFNHARRTKVKCSRSTWVLCLVFITKVIMVITRQSSLTDCPGSRAHCHFFGLQLKRRPPFFLERVTKPRPLFLCPRSRAKDWLPTFAWLAVILILTPCLIYLNSDRLVGRSCFPGLICVITVAWVTGLKQSSFALLASARSLTLQILALSPVCREHCQLRTNSEPMGPADERSLNCRGNRSIPN